MKVGEGVSRVDVYIIRKPIGGVRGIHSYLLESSSRCSNFGNIFQVEYLRLES